MECFIPELEAMDQGCLPSSTGEAGKGERMIRERYSAECTYEVTKSYRNQGDIKENSNHLELERGLLKLSKMNRRIWQKDLKRIQR